MKHLIVFVFLLVCSMTATAQNQTGADEFEKFYENKAADYMRYMQTRKADSMQIIADQLHDEVISRGVTTLYLSACKYMKAWAESAKGYTQSAFTWLEDAHKVGVKVADQEKDSKVYPLYIEMLGNLAQGYYMRGNYQKSLEVMNEMELRSLDYYHEASLQYLTTLTMKSDVLFRLARFQELSALLDKVDSISRIVPNLPPQQLAQIQSGIAKFRQHTTGQLQQAQSNTVDVQQDEMAMLEQQAAQKANSGQHQEAINILRQILTKVETQQFFDSQLYSYYVQQLCFLLSSNRSYTEALNELEKAKMIVEALSPSDPYAIRSIEAVGGKLLYSIGDYKEALKRLNNAKLMYEQAGDNSTQYYMNCIWNLAITYTESGDFAYGKLFMDEFARFLDSSFQGVTLTPEMLLSKMSFSALYGLIGYDDASIKHLEELLSNDKASVSPYLWNYSSMILSLFLMKKQNWLQAEQVLQNMYDDLSEDMAHRRQGCLLMCAAAQQRSNAAIRQKQYNDYTRQHVKAVMSSFSQLEQQIFWERQTYMLASGNYPLLRMMSNNQSVVDECYNVALYNKSMQDKSLHETYTWKDVQEVLVEGEVAIEFIAANTSFFDDKGMRYGALILRKGQSPQYVDLCNAENLVSIFQDVIHTDTAMINQLYDDDNTFLYDAIWKPLEAFLHDGDIVYYSPVGSLGQVSMSAIRDAHRQLIGKRYYIHQVSSTANIITMKRRQWQKPQNATVYGGIYYSASVDEMLSASKPYKHDDNHFPLMAQRSLSATRGAIVELEGTREEAYYIKDVLEGTGCRVSLLTGNEANEESVKALHGNAPHLLHIGTHGFMLSTNQDQASHGNLFEQISATGNQQQSLMLQTGLLMAGAYNVWNNIDVPQGIDDGILTSYEISQIDLGNCQLAVLSACETGLGFVNNAMGDIGLKRALKLAGVRTIVVSLWEVSDDATMLLMQHFYSNIAKGESPQPALEEAKEEVKKIFPQPYYWAGFCVVD